MTFVSRELRPHATTNSARFDGYGECRTTVSDFSHGARRQCPLRLRLLARERARVSNLEQGWLWNEGALLKPEGCAPRTGVWQTRSGRLTAPGKAECLLSEGPSCSIKGGSDRKGPHFGGKASCLAFKGPSPWPKRKVTSAASVLHTQDRHVEDQVASCQRVVEIHHHVLALKLLHHPGQVAIRGVERHHQPRLQRFGIGEV